MRKVQTINSPSGSARIYRDSVWDEYRVRFYNQAGQLLPKEDYHTPELGDAIGTAKAELKRKESLCHSQ